MSGGKKCKRSLDKLDCENLTYKIYSTSIKCQQISWVNEWLFNGFTSEIFCDVSSLPQEEKKFFYSLFFCVCVPRGNLVIGTKEKLFRGERKTSKKNIRFAIDFQLCLSFSRNDVCDLLLFVKVFIPILFPFLPFVKRVINK